MHLDTCASGQWQVPISAVGLQSVLGQNQAVRYTLFPLQTPQPRKEAFGFIAAQVCHHQCFLGRFKTLVFHMKN